MQSVYTLAPAYSIGQRRKDQKADDGPGFAYTPISPKSTRASTLGGRIKDLEPEHLRNPGPDYNVHESWSKVARKNPKYSIGARLKKKHLNDLDAPGPSDYLPEKITLLSQNPVWSMRGRTGKGAFDFKKDGPGAAEYSVGTKLVKERAPKATLFSRRPEISKSYEMNPGPGAHSPEYTRVKQTAPRAVMGSRTLFGSVPGPARGPGPAERDITQAAKAAQGKSPSWSMGMRKKEKDMKSWVPGPGSHDIKRKGNSVSKSMGPRGISALDYKDNGVPCANNYDVRKCLNSVGRKAPASSLGPRLSDIRRDRVPGPAKYNPDKAMNYTKPKTAGGCIQRRREDLVKHFTPGPKYSVKRNTDLGRGGFSFGSRTGIKGKSTSLGPAAYTPTRPVTSPKFSFGSRCGNKKKYTLDIASPGPASYNLGSMFGRRF